MKNNIIQSADLPQDTKVYLKKDIFGWRAVEPVHDENGKIKWKRVLFGTWRERAFLLFILFLALTAYLGFQEQLTNYKQVINNPCSYCFDCQAHTSSVVGNVSSSIQRDRFNISIFSNHG